MTRFVRVGDVSINLERVCGLEERAFDGTSAIEVKCSGEVMYRFSLRHDPQAYRTLKAFMHAHLPLKEKVTMTSTQKAVMTGCVRAIQRELQALANEPTTTYEQMKERRERADWQMVHLLRTLAEVLPNDLRAEVEACVGINDHLWSADYSQACFRAIRAHKEASSLCLAAVNSL